MSESYTNKEERKRYMKEIITKKRLALLCIILCIVSLGSAHGYDPTVVLGLFAEELIFPGNGTAGYLTNIQLNGLIGWRTKLGSASYFALNASAELNNYLYSSPVSSDSENLEMEASFPIGPNRLDVMAGLGASLLGTVTASAYARPDWQIKYRLEPGRRKLSPFIAYKGYYLYQHIDTDDALYQGVEIGFVYRPSVRLGYQTSLEGGWEGWLESALYDSAGNTTSDKRNDLLLKANGQLQGLVGYFVSWQLGSDVGLRWSNANRYVDSLSQLEENSESNWFINCEASLGWSPHRQVDFHVGAFVRQEFYLERKALTHEGDLSEQAMRVLSTGMNLRFDWTPNGRLYLVCEGAGSWRLSNDPNEELWNVTVGLGVEYSF